MKYKTECCVCSKCIESQVSLKMRMLLFFDYTLNLGKKFNGKTLIAKCTYCGAICQPPTLLIVYLHTVMIFSTLILFTVLDYCIESEMPFFLFLIAPLGILLLIIRIIPAAIACLCPWKVIELAVTEEFLSQRENFLKRKYKPLCWVYLIVGLSITYFWIMTHM